MKRRHVLLSSGTIVAGLAGCITSENNDAGTGETPTTDGDRSSDASEAEVEARATDVRQPSETEPASVDLEITNAGENAITVRPGSRGGVPFGWIGSIEGTAGEVVLYPPNARGVDIIEGELPSEREQGCWRLNMGDNAEVKPGIDSYKFDVELEPGDTHGVTQQIYYNGPNDSCFPAQEYHTEVGIELVAEDGESRDQTYNLALNIEDEFVISLKSRNT